MTTKGCPSIIIDIGRLDIGEDVFKSGFHGSGEPNRFLLRGGSVEILRGVFKHFDENVEGLGKFAPEGVYNNFGFPGVEDVFADTVDLVMINQIGKSSEARMASVLERNITHLRLSDIETDRIEDVDKIVGELSSNSGFESSLGAVFFDIVVAGGTLVVFSSIGNWSGVKRDGFVDEGAVDSF